MSAKFWEFPSPFCHCPIHKNYFSTICFWVAPSPLLCRRQLRIAPQRHMAPKSHKYRFVGRCDVHLSAARRCSALRSVPICPTEGETRLIPLCPLVPRWSRRCSLAPHAFLGGRAKHHKCRHQKVNLMYERYPFLQSVKFSLLQF